MKAAELKIAASLALKKFLETGNKERDVREYSTVVYPEDGIIIVTYMRRDTDEWPVQKSFDITVMATPKR